MSGINKRSTDPGNGQKKWKDLYPADSKRRVDYGIVDQEKAWAKEKADKAKKQKK
jgi:hypothetical protein